MVGRPVAFDPCEIAARRVRVHDCEIDAELGDADLCVNLPPPVLKALPSSRLLERGFVSRPVGAKASAIARGPRSANSRKCLKSLMARAFVRLRSIWSGLSVAKTTISCRARVIATFRRL